MIFSSFINTILISLSVLFSISQENKGKIKFYPAKSRGKADYGWLKANYSFSFSQYYDPQKMQFGALRVLNDDYIAGGKGFGKHRHENMEIITIPIEGGLAHTDDANGGHKGSVVAGQVQVMSAGTGVRHSEFNASKEKTANTLQLWVIPDKKDVEPRYMQKNIPTQEANNSWTTIVGPQSSDALTWIHQNAYFSIAKLNKGKSLNYSFFNKNGAFGVYTFLIEGSVEVNGQQLDDRDAAGITETDSLNFNSLKDSYILVIEVPMN